MARSNINNGSQDVISDDGSVLLSVIRGEQIHLEVNLGWITDLTSYTITAKIVEADSSEIDHTDPTSLPLTRPVGGQVTTLAIIDPVITDGDFKIVIPADLVDSYNTLPLPEKPSYGWIGVEISDGATGANKQIWKPLRGLVEILYSPSEEI